MGGDVLSVVKADAAFRSGDDGAGGAKGRVPAGTSTGQISMNPLHRWPALLLLALGLLFCLPAAAAPSFPVLSGRVVDQANVLPPQVEADLAAKLEALETATARQLVVVTVSSLQGYEIEDYGYQLGRIWGIGDARQNTGVLLLVAPTERRVRIEVGYGLEPVLTDALSNAILQEKVLPHFRSGDISSGVMAGADALLEQLSLPEGQASDRVAEAASGEAKADPLSLFLIGLVVLWIVAGMIGTLTGRRTEIWFWPLFFLTRGGRDGRAMFRGRGGSFGGGGASGRW
jgi:uncharacterized protein